jgi:hypothetical protein
MEPTRTLVLNLLMISWIVITIVLVAVCVYRGMLSVREDDQIFIGSAEQHHYPEQLALISRMSRLTKPIIALGVISAVLLLASASVWMYSGFVSF